MFGKMKNMAEQMQLMQQLMRDENFKALMAHPKMQAFMRDPNFLEAMKGQDLQKVATDPKLAELKNDPELIQLISRVSWPKT